ncbi:MAG: glycosyltransferase family 39 protein, partial [Candidatus Omnitrophica bacterium]|nr:glycosyltransferase family 39 protein [Candidatus Omnitrophota bacterium]
MPTSTTTVSSIFGRFFLKPWVAITFVLCVSFSLKVALRLFLSQHLDFWESGYSFYYKMALNFLQTGELYLQNEHGLYLADKLYAIRTPLYPFFIAIIGKWTHFSVVAFVIVQALISTLTVVVVYKIAARFNSKAAFLSALLYALYPYSLFHDTQLQENVLYNFLSLMSVWSLLVSVEKNKNLLFFLSGSALGFCVLTRASHLVHTFFLIIFLFYKLRKNVKKVLVPISLILLGLLLTLSPWIIRNKRVVGSFTITSLTGGTLAEAHNEFTFLY